jgi:hypothetical protein
VNYFFLIKNHVLRFCTAMPLALTESEKYFFSTLDLQFHVFDMNGFEDTQVDTAGDGVSWVIRFLA